MRKGAGIILVIGVLLISGCTGGGQVSSGVSSNVGGYGLVVTELKSDDAVLEAGDIALIILNVTNVDKESATTVDARIFPSGMEGTKTTDEEFEIEAGDSVVFEFDLAASRNLNIDRTYTPYGEICYNYRALASSGHFVIDNDFYSSTTQIPEIPSVSNNGPVIVALDPLETIKIRKAADETAMEGRNKTIAIKFTNIDTGYVINSIDGFVSATAERNKLKARSLVFKITATGQATVTTRELEGIGQTFACSRTQSDLTDDAYKDSYDIATTSNDIVYCTNLEEVSFGSDGGGKTLRLPVEFTVTAGGQDTVFFEAESTYRYCIQTPQISILATRAD